ncbi:T9SS type A sorting domain-containing protein [bacterium]|nr:T9SS type A sorting domain-containing protein [bacterium]
MTDQEYESDDATKYSPVTATDTDDTSLPVTMSTFTATASEQEGVTISWRTESEVNTAGFNVLRSQGGNGTWSKLNGTLIPGQGNSSAGMDYSYIDRDVREGIEYWYKVEEVSTDDQITVYGPISVMGVNAVPAEFSLSQNYPNPFNPETSFKYMVAEDADVTIGVYNLLGKEIKRIVSGRQPAGYYAATWTGVDNTGRSVASGIYFIRMQADNFQMVRKISLMR